MKKLSIILLITMVSLAMVSCGNRNAKKAATEAAEQTEVVIIEEIAPEAETVACEKPECCKEGAECCKEGAECCKNNPDCCKEGAECCKEGAECCKTKTCPVETVVVIEEI